MAEDKIKILPIGGLGEIGMNCLVLESDTDMVLIDCGLQFPDASYPGVDVLVPDFSYVRERMNKLRGVVVTHGHDDHIGAIPFLLRETNLQVWATPFPTGLLKQKLSEFEDCRKIEFHEIKPREKFQVGCFTFDPISVQHSIIEALAFAIETPVGTIIHSGDFKHDPKEQSRGEITFQAFHEYGDKGVLLLMSDSTNAEREGHTLSESDIEKSFESLLQKQTGRILIALFASNIRRLERILRIAKGQGKKVAFVGRSMHSYTRLAWEQKSLTIPEDTLILAESIQNFPDNQVLILATGSQAEPRSALLRIAEGIHKDVKIQKGDLVIMSSRFIPGNERSITRMIDNLYRAGAEVLYESIHQIHVSGHGFQDELMMMLRAARPKFFIPIHGEYRHLAKHGNLANKSGVQLENVCLLEDGQGIELSPDKVTFLERLDFLKHPAVENIYVDGSPEALSQRAALARSGVVFVAMLRDRQTGELVLPPEVRYHGLLLRHGEDPTTLAEDASKHLEDVYWEMQNHPELKEVIRLETRRFFRRHTSHKPIAIPIIMDLDD